MKRIGAHLCCAYVAGRLNEHQSSAAAKLPFSTPIKVDHWRDRCARTATLVATTSSITARSSTLQQRAGKRVLRRDVASGGDAAATGPGGGALSSRSVAYYQHPEHVGGAMEEACLLLQLTARAERHTRYKQLTRLTCSCKTASAASWWR